MSKSSGNFKTIRESVGEFSADATRFALADAGDTVDDANYETDTANSAILRLTKEMTWIEEMLAAEKSFRTGPFTTADKMFENEINIATSETRKNYEEMLFRDALKSEFYDFQTAKDESRVTCGSDRMHKMLQRRFIDVQTKLIAPICPPYAEYVWHDLIGNKGFAAKSGFPSHDAPHAVMQRANKYIRNVIVEFRKLLERKRAPPKNAKKTVAPSAPNHVQLAQLLRKTMEAGRQLRSKDPMLQPDQEILAKLKSSPMAQARRCC